MCALQVFPSARECRNVVFFFSFVLRVELSLKLVPSPTILNPFPLLFIEPKAYVYAVQRHYFTTLIYRHQRVAKLESLHITALISSWSSFYIRLSSDECLFCCWIQAMAQVGGLVMLQPEVGGSRDSFFFAGIDKVRFRKPVIAGDTLVMKMTLTKLQKRFGIAKMEGKAYVGGDVVCEGEFLMAMGSSE